MTANLPTGNDLLAHLVVEAPRYTSYPTAVDFSSDVDAVAYADRLAAADSAGSSQPLALYVHLPFCRALCDFCGCHALVARTHNRIERYLDALEQELELVARHLPHRRTVGELHLGGGSPSVLTCEDTARLFAAIRRLFDLPHTAAISVEVDPRTVDRAKLETYRRCGVRRISMGFQDLDPGVQEAIGRHQSIEASIDAYIEARRAGFDAINVDLCYGLPRQTEATFDETLAQVIALAPDRISIFGYAHVPWLKPLQRRINQKTLPGSDVRVRLQSLCRERLIGAGYRSIGMDHFALPGDPLTRALDQGRLHRNFQGYTETSGTDLVGVGVSAIGDVAGAFVQNHRSLGGYHDAIAAGQLATERGVRRTADDELRAHVIRRIMCDFALDEREVSARFGIDFETTFAAELRELEELVAQGLVERAPGRLTLLPTGRVFVRNVASVFDARRRERSESPARVRLSTTA
ncbi:MAG TPA: oxygen-independent coproporphyrinogen III oxidase [Polyangia bacterium]|nr:oxygen-independent coproporphyrinogen III oxidase [Polyangia bacterium]